MDGYTRINRSIKFGDSELIITKKFAEEHLSPEARAMAERTKTSYVWVVNKTAACVYFELPQTFNMTDFYHIMPMLFNYCVDYLRARGLSDNVAYTKFVENCQIPAY